MGAIEIEASCIEDRIKPDLTEVHFFNLGIGIERPDHLARKVSLLRACSRNLVEYHDICKLDLFDQQVDQRTLILIAQRFTAVAQKIIRRIVFQQIGCINHRDHRIKARQIGQAFALFISKLKGCCHRQRLRYARRFDQQIIETILSRELGYFFQKIIPQSAADAAIGHFNELFLGSG